MATSVSGPWTTVITPKKKLLDIKFRELIKYRDLLYLLVRRDFVAQYKQSILGPLWFFIQPLMNTIVFTIIFGKIAKIPTDGVPDVVFYMAGNLVWSFFAAVFTDVGQTFAGNSNLFSKVYFPRLVSPLALTINKFFTFCFQFLLFLGFFLFFFFAGSSLKPNIMILFLPLLVIHIGLIGISMGLMVSSLTTKYRDLRFLVTFGLQLWMYATPVVYPASMIPHGFLWIYYINPIAPVVELFRYMFFGIAQVNTLAYSVSIVETLALTLIGLMLFTRTEKDFIDRI